MGIRFLAFLNLRLPVTL